MIYASTWIYISGERRVMRFLAKVAIWFTLLTSLCSGDVTLKETAETSLREGVRFFHSISIHGGYLYHVTPDLQRRWGEQTVDNDHTIEVQPPGTPAVGMSFLLAFAATADEKALRAARDAGSALIRGQNKHGGWNHTINFRKLDDETISFDDNQTQSAVRFLMALDQTTEDPEVSTATQRALKMMVETQLDSGGWPHKYPKQGNYHDFATYNDGGINDCVGVMMDAHRRYPNNKAIEKSLRKAARFIVISQLPPPQPGWAQQYNEFLQPAWARTFEPPAVCPSVSVKNINTLIDLYVALGKKTLLEPIPDSLRWMQGIRMENGKWARFVELGTNKPLYYDRGRIRVNSMEELHIERRRGYAYETNLESALKKTSKRYELALKLDRGKFQAVDNDNPKPTQEQDAQRVKVLSTRVRQIVNRQELSGAWVSHDDRFKKRMPKGVRWNGEYEVTDRISSSVFNRNVETLCEYLELSKKTNSE